MELFLCKQRPKILTYGGIAGIEDASSSVCYPAVYAQVES